MRSTFTVLLLSTALLIATCSLGAAQGYENKPPLPGETFYLRPVSAESPQPPADLASPPRKAVSRQTEAVPRQREANRGAAPAPDLSDLGAMAGGAATLTEPSLPFMMGDTTWGGRPAFPQVIAPARWSHSHPGLPILTTAEPLGLRGLRAKFLVTGDGSAGVAQVGRPGAGPAGIPGPARINTYLPFGAMLLSSPIIGYDMINWAENGCILPQDRVFFDYRHFDAVGSVEIVNVHAPDATHPNAYYQPTEYSTRCRSIVTASASRRLSAAACGPSKPVFLSRARRRRPRRSVPASRWKTISRSATSAWP